MLFLLSSRRLAAKDDRVPVDERFAALAQELNSLLFDGEGRVTLSPSDNQTMLLTSDTKRYMAVEVARLSGSLRLTVYHKFLNETFSHQAWVHDLWNATPERQREISRRFAAIAKEKIEEHRKSSLF